MGLQMPGRSNDEDEDNGSIVAPESISSQSVVIKTENDCDSTPQSFSSIRLPFELWMQIIIEIKSSDDICSLSRTCKGLRSITSNNDVRAAYIMRKCMPCEAFYQASLRPAMFKEPLLRVRHHSRMANAFNGDENL